MAKVIHYYAHPGHRFSRVNRSMWDAAEQVPQVTRVDLYQEYPRHYIVIDREQQRLIDHDVIVVQFPIFLYSSPSLVKEWLDVTLEHGFAYGEGGDKLSGKYLMLAVTTASSREAYSIQGYQQYPLRTFLTPFEQTARISKMQFLAPYVLHSALEADITQHAHGFSCLLSALVQDRYDLQHAAAADIVTHDSLPIC